MRQISIFRRNQKFANVPVPRIGAVYIQNVTQVPSEVMSHIRNFARGIIASQRLGEWSWEWQRVGSPVKLYL